MSHAKTGFRVPASLYAPDDALFAGRDPLTSDAAAAAAVLFRQGLPERPPVTFILPRRYQTIHEGKKNVFWFPSFGRKVTGGTNRRRLWGPLSVLVTMVVGRHIGYRTVFSLAYEKAGMRRDHIVA